MPDRGQLELARASVPSLVSRGELRLQNARLAQVTFEVDQQAALAALPELVNRPVPCYARVVVVDAPESEFGAFTVALVFVGSRYRLMARNVLAGGVVKSDGHEQVAEALGCDAASGCVSLERNARDVRAEVTVDGHRAIAIELPATFAIEPSMLRWDPWLAVMRHGDVVGLAEAGPRVENARAFLSKGARADIGAAPAQWAGLRSLNTVSACYIEGDIILPGYEIQQTLG